MGCTFVTFPSVLPETLRKIKREEIGDETVVIRKEEVEQRKEVKRVKYDSSGGRLRFTNS